MNKVLVIASGFPPQGGGGVTRIHSFVKYLPKFDWQPIVLTLKEKYAYSHAIDFSLLEEYDLNVEIYRTGSVEPSGIMGRSLKNGLTGFSRKNRSFASKLKKIFKYFYDLLLIPDEKILWLIPAIIKAWKLIKGKKISIILLTSPPHSVSLIGYVITKITGIPMVWDIRDDWIGNRYFDSNHWYRSKIESFLESMVISRAEMIIVVTAESKDLVVHKYPTSSEKVRLIPNGFDPDILKMNSNSGDSENNFLCKFIYAGSLTWRRNLTSFFEAIAEMNRNGELINQIRIDFVGSVHQKHIENIEKFGLEDIVSIHGHVSHRDSIRKLIDANVCMLISAPEEGSRTVIPSKIYEYLALKRYVFALAEEDSAVANLMREQQFGLVISPSDAESIRDGLVTTLAAFRNGTLKVSVSDDFINQFNRLLLTEKLAESFNQLVAEKI